MRRLEPGAAAAQYCTGLRRAPDRTGSVAGVITSSTPVMSATTPLRDAEVTAVGDQREAIARDHDRRCRGEQAAQIRDVRQRRDQQRVEAGLAHVAAKPRVAREAKRCGRDVHQADAWSMAIDDDRGEPVFAARRSRVRRAAVARALRICSAAALLARSRAAAARGARTDRCRPPAVRPASSTLGSPSWRRSTQRRRDLGLRLRARRPVARASVSKSKRSSIDDRRGLDFGAAAAATTTFSIRSTACSSSGSCWASCSAFL